MRNMRISQVTGGWVKALACQQNEGQRWKSLCILHNIFAREYLYCNFEVGSSKVLDDFLVELGKMYEAVGKPPGVGAERLIDRVLNRTSESG